MQPCDPEASYLFRGAGRNFLAAREGAWHDRPMQEPVSFSQYQQRAFVTALPAAHNLTYMLVGLANEAGEAAGKLKKVLRGDRTVKEAREDILAELGDVLWYISGAASVLDASLEEIAAANLAKLADRKERGVLQGNGDNR